MEANNLEVQVKSWLKTALTKEKFQEFSVKISGSTEKGSGYIGDVLFVTVVESDQKDVNKEHHLVLKCSKSSKALMKNHPAFMEAFVREIYLYETIIPAFKKFELDRGIEDPFDSVPKCYGVFKNDSKFVIVLENLTTTGYDMWDCKKPLNRKHIDMVVKEYAKFHATSVAMKEQEPENFEKLLDPINGDLLAKFMDTTNLLPVFENNITELQDLLKNYLENDVLEKWLCFKETVKFMIYGMTEPVPGELQTITHGDCWNNNYMYKHRGEEPVAVAMLDWQVIRLHSPVIDLSYFLFANLGEDDILDLDNILRLYYDSLIDRLIKLGSSFIKNYSFEQFLKEWKKYSKYGVIMCITPVKFSYIDTEDKPDLGQTADDGLEISDSFSFDINKINIGYIKRIKPIVKYAAESELFK